MALGHVLSRLQGQENVPEACNQYQPRRNSCPEDIQERLHCQCREINMPLYEDEDCKYSYLPHSFRVKVHTRDLDGTVR